VTGQAGLRRFLEPPPAPAAAPPGTAPAPAPQDTVPQDTAPQTTGPQTTGPQTTGPGSAAGPGPPGPEQERCEMCATEVGAAHSHVADLEQSSLMCVCRACYLLFSRDGAGGGRYRGVPDRYLRDPSRPLSAAGWDELQIPVGLAFFLYSSQRGAVSGFYPSPAGATECLLDLDAWARLAQAHPLLRAAEQDVEAVLICRSGNEVEYFIVPIDVCYELAGRMRMLWKGFDGGTEARESIAAFLAGVRAKAKDLVPEP
jgi:Family of unknown function (DUF5947)